MGSAVLTGLVGKTGVINHNEISLALLTNKCRESCYWLRSSSFRLKYNNFGYLSIQVWLKGNDTNCLLIHYLFSPFFLSVFLSFFLFCTILSVFNDQRHCKCPTAMDSFFNIFYQNQKKCFFLSNSLKIEHKTKTYLKKAERPRHWAGTLLTNFRINDPCLRSVLLYYSPLLWSSYRDVPQ